MKLCTKCNCSNQDSDIVCNSCGAVLDDAKEPEVVSGSNMNSFNSSTYANSNEPMPVKTNGMAIASMVLGIVSVPLMCCCGAGTITAILAVILGFISKNKIKASGGAEKGNGMALAGIILGFASVLFLIIYVIYIITVGGGSSQFWEEFQNEFQKQMNNVENSGTN